MKHICAVDWLNFKVLYKELHLVDFKRYGKNKVYSGKVLFCFSKVECDLTEFFLAFLARGQRQCLSI